MLKNSQKNGARKWRNILHKKIKSFRGNPDCIRWRSIIDTLTIPLLSFFIVTGLKKKYLSYQS